MKIHFKHFVSFFFAGTIFCLPFGSVAQDGATLFKQNCAACHKLGTRLVGPNLIGVTERRDEDWLLRFIKSSQTMIQEGDADAVAIYEEFGQMVMNDQNLSDDEIRAILAYITEESPSNSLSTENKVEEIEEVVVPIEYTAEDIKNGLLLFNGQKSFNAKGPSCISCHNINNAELIAGGLLAKDLTNVHARMGDAGLAGILGAPPFPAMATAYNGRELDSTEIAQLTAFLKYADEVSEEQVEKSGFSLFFIGGGGGLILLFLLIALHWNRRLRKTVKHDIYKRQIKGSDSII